ncbi:DUF3027 domain-containing protein [Kocuria sp. HSID16901]|uniref:DUF3027 domain-containing protein n=1 Tax=Kocuria sp. HSID16901 TaxID=2419505 RepID=UPI0009E5BC41|nr:DUF3027 domain-containing protein [Kocuria sp. HSID16901]RUQ21299.1 DUF3027 domain-containing protein [Kocuria sp. HSID16901]
MSKTVQDEPVTSVSSGAATSVAERAEAPTTLTLGSPRKVRRRTTRLDAVLAEAQDVARAGVLEITSESTIGTIHHVRGEEDRLSTHLFECTLPGYRGWYWFSTVARAPRSKKVTVCEVGLVPGDGALLAPEWVPWADRVRPEDIENEEPEETNAPETSDANDDREDSHGADHDADSTEGDAPEE